MERKTNHLDAFFSAELVRGAMAQKHDDDEHTFYCYQLVLLGVEECFQW